ncbi:MAG TPA: GMC oxidoreductase [Devosiaceae bacterium]|nr:GMC oxidoreductase [Devosiaceae bacterium]
MFVPFDPSLNWAAYDYVIIGAGPAGLFLADKFATKGRVLILEAGSRDLSSATGDGYYDLEVTDRGYGTLGERLSTFGGTSNHWGGHSHPLGPATFSNRPGFPGWPITYADYALHLPEARNWLNLGPFEAEPGRTGVERDLLGHSQYLSALHFQFSNPIRRFGDDPTVQKYASAPDIDVVLDTRVIDIHLDHAGKTVEKLDLFHLPSGRTATIPAKILFLAAGGIENPRLMLWAARKYQAGNPFAGGRNNITGKYFMEHPAYSPVDIYIDARADLTALKPHLNATNEMVNVVLTPSDDFLAAHELNRMAMHFQDTPFPASTDYDIQTGQALFVSHPVAYSRITPFFIFEQTPDAQSFVGLSQKMGKDGTPLARLNWHLSDDEVKRYRKGVMLFCGLLNQYGLAKTRFVGDATGPDWSNVQFGNAAHHMGATRMAHDALGGVVDSNCKVFGLDNMYIAGSSVFPATDIVNPTLNLMALTARLANFILTTSPDANVGVNYRFGVGRDANKTLGKGWATPDAAGVWSDGPEATLTLERNRATKLSIMNSAAATAGVKIEINGKQVYDGPANALSSQSFPLDDEDRVAMLLHLSGPPAPKGATGNDAHPAAIYLQSVILT